jgi:predicted CoA-binding protein
MKKTLVLGASTNPQRYSYLAIIRLKANGHDVIAVGKTSGSVADVPLVTQLPDASDIHTVTLYLNPALQEQYIPAVLSLKPKRIIFNPGTENDHFRQMAEDAGIKTLEACTLVMLASGQY